jgi:hypothetical protein
MWPLVLLAVGIVFAGVYELLSRKRRADAADEFRTAILSTLSGLYPEPTRWPKSIDTYLLARLPVLHEIIESFRPNVPQKDIPAYNDDWDNYYDFCHAVTDDQCVEAETNSALPDPKKKFHTLISNLLRHAD